MTQKAVRDRKGTKDMSDQNSLVVEGYKFSSARDAELARREVKKIEYLNKNIGNLTPDKVLNLYNRTIDGKVFQTPIGWSYLKTIREWLMQADYTEEELKPVPLYTVFARDEEEEIPRARQRIITPPKKIPYRANYRTSLAVNIILAILVAAMLIIAKKSDAPNIINYRECILNEYSEWEESLTRREKAVRAKESRLGIEDTEAYGETGVQDESKAADSSK